LCIHSHNSFNRHPYPSPPPDQPTASIDLRSARSLERIPSPTSARPPADFHFSIQCADASFHFCAESDASQTQWLTALDPCISAHLTHAPLDLERITRMRARDSEARALGARWYLRSGASTLEASSAVDNIRYEQYAAESDELYRADAAQIDKDLDGRSDAESFSSAGLTAFLDPALDAECRIALRRLLMAFVKRNSRFGGYTQGMNYVCRLLLAVLDEHQVFWTLCTMAESLRIPDFYSPPPASMNGYLIERNVCAQLVLASQPSLSGARAEELRNCVEILAPKWFISSFIDAAPIDVRGCAVFLVISIMLLSDP
jgi:hypothetical protein